MHHSDSATVTTVDTLAKLLDVCGELRSWSRSQACRDRLLV